MTTHTPYPFQPALVAFTALLLFGLPTYGQILSPQAWDLTSPAHISRYTAALKSDYQRYFEQTGKLVSGDFLRTFDKDGLAQIGYPISDEMTDGGLTVQYFERARMEYHPEMAGKDAAVQLTRLGAQLAPSRAFSQVQPFTDTPGDAYVPETGHSLATPFLEYWRDHGGLDIFGYPISEALTQDGLYVQWFERARMEYHPEHKGTEWAVQLTQLGSVAYNQAYGTAAEQVVVSPDGSIGMDEQEGRLLALINSKRAEAGIMPLTEDSSLGGIARSRSSDMAERSYFSHITPEGRTFMDLLHEQNIAFGFAGEAITRNNAQPEQTVQLAMDT
ncbi:MAG TPA: CAP domain-containing protein, partial [Chloroflexia bacterium]|nr:CAP domain-containing protein [Chloroflexia bacterium]